MSATGGGADAGGSKRHRDNKKAAASKDCSLEGVLAKCINAYARNDEDDTLNAALYSVVREEDERASSYHRGCTQQQELTLQMTFSHHILDQPGRVNVGSGADLDGLDEEDRRRKQWPAATCGALAALIEGRVTECCAGPFFLVLWRGTDFTAPASLECYQDKFAVAELESSLEDEPVTMVLQVGGLRPERPAGYGDGNDDEEDKEYDRALAAWTKIPGNIAAKVRAIIGLASP